MILSNAIEAIYRKYMRDTAAALVEDSTNDGVDIGPQAVADISTRVISWKWIMRRNSRQGRKVF